MRSLVISSEYREQNRLLHKNGVHWRKHPGAKKQAFGGSGGKWAAAMAGLMMIANSRHFKDWFLIESVLDYGCGPSRLVKVAKQWTDLMRDYIADVGLKKRPSMDIDYREYDPCIEGKDGEPKPADLVMCTDVLEHIEPELLDNVLDHLDSLILKIGFFVIRLEYSQDIMPDGTPAHRIVESYGWWLKRFERMKTWNVFLIPVSKPHKVMTCLVLKKEYTEWHESLQKAIEQHATIST